MPEPRLDPPKVIGCEECRCESHEKAECTYKTCRYKGELENAFCGMCHYECQCTCHDDHEAIAIEQKIDERLGK